MTLGIPYTVDFSSKSRRMSIHLDAQGNVVVRAPRGVSRSIIASFVESARDWIAEQQSSQQQKPVLLSATRVFYFGKEYTVKVSSRFDGTVKVARDTIIASPLTSTRLVQATVTLLSAWLKNRAVEYITKRVYELSEQMQLPFAGLAFKQQKTRWGSCSSYKNLNFNWKLIHAPSEVIDYVIIHELAHTKEMNHGKRFWDLVARFDPDHTHHRRWLTQYGSTED